jgi:hypothetical protein
MSTFTTFVIVRQIIVTGGLIEIELIRTAIIPVTWHCRSHGSIVCSKK